MSQVEVVSLKGLPFAIDGHWILVTYAIDEEPGFASTGRKAVIMWRILPVGVEYMHGISIAEKPAWLRFD